MMEEYRELEEMRRQLALLKAEVAKQNLRNDLNMRRMAKNQVSSLKRKFWLKVVICVFGLLYCPMAFYDILDASIWFVLVTEAFLLLSLLFEIYSHLDLWSDRLNTDMVDYSWRMLRIKRLNAKSFFWGMAFVFPWFAWFVWEGNRNSEFEYQWLGLLIGGLIGGLIGFAIGYHIYRKEQRTLQDLAEQLGELPEE